MKQFCKECGAKRVNNHQIRCYFCNEKFSSQMTKRPIRKKPSVWFFIAAVGLLIYLINDKDFVNSLSEGMMYFLIFGGVFSYQIYRNWSKPWVKMIFTLISIICIGGYLFFKVLVPIAAFVIPLLVLFVVIFILSKKKSRNIAFFLGLIGLKFLLREINSGDSSLGTDIQLNDSTTFVDPHEVSGYERSDGTPVSGYWRDGDGNTDVNLRKEEGGGYYRKSK